MNALVEVAPQTLLLMAHDVMQALELLQEDKFAPDCVFVELSMPRIDGIEFLSKVKKVDSLKKVLVILHHQEPIGHKVIQLREPGVFAIYSQPYNYIGVCNILNIFMTQDIKVFVNSIFVVLDSGVNRMGPEILRVFFFSSIYQK